MRFSSPNTEELNLNLAPLIDVVFLLLIFFMVTTSFTQQKAMDLQLPEANTGGKQLSPNALTLNISVNKNNQVRLLNEQAQLAEISAEQSEAVLAEKIAEALENIKSKNALATDKAATIIIEADQSASHGRVIQLMDVISKLGINQIQFAVEAPK